MSQKLKLNFLSLVKRKNAYMQLDFIFALAVFIILFHLIFTYYDSYSNSFKDSIILSNLQADSKDICYLLLEHTGTPIDWEYDISNLKQIGLRNISSQKIDSVKLLSFNESNYFKILDSLLLNSFLYIEIYGLESGNDYLNFGSRDDLASYSSRYSCYSVYNDEVVRVFVEVWR